MDLLTLFTAVKQAGQAEVVTNHNFLVYGLPKTGKTELVATVAEAEEFDTIYWFDPDNGIETVRRMFKDGKISEAALRKIVYIKIPDTRVNPQAIVTLLAAICTRNPVTICEQHGAVACADCKREGKGSIPFHYVKLTKRCAIVIDSLSAVGDSALNKACEGKPSEYKPQLDDYGSVNKWLTDLCITLQAAEVCPVFAITHATVEKDELGNEKITPICGSSTFSGKVAKYFGTVIYMEKKMGKHKASSTSLSNMGTQAGSRLGLNLDTAPKLDLVQSLRDCGYFTSLQGAPSSPALTVKAVSEEAPKSGLAAMLNKS